MISEIKKNFSKIMYTCKPTPIPEMKGLVVLGYFNISENEAKWVQEIPQKKEYYYYSKFT